MGIYTTIADLEAYLDDFTPAADPAVDEKEIARAERDLDQHCFFGGRPLEDNGRAQDPAALDPDDVEALNRATCAQVEFRREMGPEHFIRAQRERVTGRSFSAAGKLPMIGPKVWRELRLSTLVDLTTDVGNSSLARSDRDVGWHEV